VATNNWKYLSEIGVDVLIHGCEIPRVAGVGITTVEKDECCLWAGYASMIGCMWAGEDSVKVMSASPRPVWNWTG
jgi:hypothetical protein